MNRKSEYLHEFCSDQSFVIGQIHVCFTVMDICESQTQTGSLLNENLKSLESCIYLSCTSVQVKKLFWGQHNQCQSLEVTRTKADITPERGGPSNVVAIRISDVGIGEFCISGNIEETFVCFTPHSSGHIIISNELKECLTKLSSTFVFCCGIDCRELRVACPGISLSSKRISQKESPFPRYVSTQCVQWFPLRFNASKSDQDDASKGNLRCLQCSMIFRQLRAESKKLARKLEVEGKVAPILEIKKRRVEASSHYPIHLLSPASAKKRITNLRTEKLRKNMKMQRLLERIEHYNLALTNAESEELSEFLSIVQEDDIDRAHSAVLEQTSESIADTLRATFEADQKRNSEYTNNYVRA